MELVFVQENGHPDFDGMSETSEESNEDGDEERCWEYVGFSNLSIGRHSTSWGCSLPISTELPSLEKVSSRLHVAISLLTAFFSGSGPITFSRSRLERSVFALRS
jgi:hypothetical protein